MSFLAQNKRSGSVMEIEIHDKLSKLLPYLHDFILLPYKAGVKHRQQSDKAFKKSKGNFGVYVAELGKLHGREMAKEVKD